MTLIRNTMIRDVKKTPFDKAFIVDGNETLCHATGYEVCFGDPRDPGAWMAEYEDPDRDLHYGR